MINLIPPERKREYRAARFNMLLRGYLLVAVATLTSMGVIFGGSLYINTVNRTTYEQRFRETEERLSDLREARAKTQQFNNNLKQAKLLYNGQVKFSGILAKISEKVPPGAVLSGLTLNTSELSKPLNLIARVDTVEKAAILKANFDASGYFTNVSIQNISSEGGSGYAYSVNMLITLSQEILKASKEEPS